MRARPPRRTTRSPCGRHANAGSPSPDNALLTAFFRSLLAARRELLSLLLRLADVADHVEGLLGQLVVLAVDHFAEALHGVRELDVAAGLTGELLGDGERLGQEPLDLARARHDHLVVVRELLHPEDGNYVLKIFVALQDQLHVARGAVVL